MLLLLFEVTPRAGHVDEYLGIAAQLRPLLDAVGGCVFIDRYRSLARPGTLLSFQVWRDEAAMTRWRVHADHRQAQARGRARVFEDYRLRVAEIVRSEALGEPAWQAGAAAGQGGGPGRVLAVAESASATVPGAMESFESIYRPGEHVHVLGSAADPPTLATLHGAHRLHVAAVRRDYGMHDRSEAPGNTAPDSSHPRRPS